MADARPASFYSQDPVNYKTGHLNKQGGRIKTWKKRFFVLEKRNKILRYYKREDDSLPKGVIHMVGYKVSEAEEELKRPHAFKIEQNNFRTYYMVADDANVKKEWMNVLTECSIQDGTSSLSISAPERNFDNDTDLSDDEEDSKKLKRPLSPTLKKINNFLGRNNSNNNVSDQTLVTRARVPSDEATIALSYARNNQSTRPSGAQDAAIPTSPDYYRDPNATLICEYERPDPNVTLVGADMLAYRAANDPNATLVGVMPDDNATLVGVIVDDNATLFPGNEATLINNSGKVKQQFMSKSVPHVRLVPHNNYFRTIDRDVLTTLKFGRLQPNAQDEDRDFIGFDSKVVSRRHSEIWAVNEEFYIRDTKSQSGTFLNAMRLSLPGEESKPFKLKNGDIIQFGVDYRGSNEDNTKCVSMVCELSFRKVKTDEHANTPQHASPQMQLSDLTLIGQGRS